MASLAVVFDLIAKDRASADINKVGAAAEGSGKKFDGLKTAVTVASAAVAAAAGKLAADSIKSAGNAEQAFGGVEAVFGKAAGSVEKYADTSAKRLGLAGQDYATLAATVGSQLQRMGQSQDESAASTDKLITLGSDLAATFGGSVSDAVSAVSSLLRGERDPIERYAVGINEAAIKSDLAAKGLSGLEGAALEQAKAQSTLSLLFEQTANAQGQSARESGTLQGQTQRLAAQYKDLTAEFGAKLLPFVTDSLDKFQSLSTFVGNNATAVGSLTAAVVGGAAAFFAVTKAIAAFNAIALALGSSVTIALGPIGIAIITIAALSAAAVVAYKTNETFREIVQNAWAKVKEAVKVAWDAVIRPVLTALTDYIQKTVIPTIERLWRDVVLPAFKAIGEFIRDTWTNVIKPILSALNTFVREVVGPTLEWLWKNVVKPTFEAIGSDIKFAWDNIISPIFKALNAFLRDVVGPTIKWLWENIAKPAFEGISHAVKAAWGIVGPIFGAMKDGLGFISDNVKKAKDKLDDFIKAMKDFELPGWVKDLAKFTGNIGDGLKGAASKVGGLFNDGPGIGGSPGGQPRGVEAMMAALPKGTRLISGYRPGAITATGNPSYHGKGRAVDLPPSMALFNYIKERFGSVAKELIFSPAGARQVHNGRERNYTGVTRANHFDHVHWAMHQGGQIGSNIPRLSGDGPTERTIRTQVGEVITTGADMSDLLAEIRGLRAEFRRFPAATRELVRTM